MDVVVRAEGLRDLRRDLKQIDKSAPREINKAMRESLAPVVAEARGLAPRRSGALAQSIRPFATATKVGLRSPLPYAPWIHWGGTIRPRGVPITRGPESKGGLFALRAADQHLDQIVDRVADALDMVARRHGFH